MKVKLLARDLRNDSNTRAVHGALVGDRRIGPDLVEPPKLVDRGALYQKADQPWAPFAVEDNRLISGQNPASGGAVADLLLKALRERA